MIDPFKPKEIHRHDSGSLRKKLLAPVNPPATKDARGNVVRLSEKGQRAQQCLHGHLENHKLRHPRPASTETDSLWKGKEEKEITGELDSGLNLKKRRY